MRRAGLYARVSREEQAEGYSVDAQLEAMHQFCQAKGWTIASEYVDPGASGTTQDRPAFLKLLADCEAGQLDVIVTHQLDRLMRNLRLQLDILGRLGEWKVAYVSVTEQIDYSAPQGSLFLSMLGTFNEYYVANLKREIRKGKRGRARKGLPNNSRMICGYKRKGDKIVVDPEGAVAARFMFEKYATGHYSLQALASLMNQRFPQEARWSPRRVGDGLKNPLYIGQVRYHDHVYRGQHEAIIDKDRWQRVQQTRARRKQRRIRRAKHFSLLSGLARCHLCKRPLWSQVQPCKSYFYCSATRRGTDFANSETYTGQNVIEPS